MENNCVATYISHVYNIYSELCNKLFGDEFYLTILYNISSFFSRVDQSLAVWLLKFVTPCAYASLYTRIKGLRRRPQSKLSHCFRTKFQTSLDDDATPLHERRETTCRGITFVRTKLHASFANPSSLRPLIYARVVYTLRVQATSEKRINNPATERPVSLVNWWEQLARSSRSTRRAGHRGENWRGSVRS